ncbi:phosphate ABC transporter permease subunit PstC [Nocardioides sp. JQ2195]|uniref:phosphate ABC transporter permease subunit PstC n=1 Tax=Nocardioides sp. JQ2195 TaxID=2592334 RepID=UPI00143E6F46|nr:phosphate ABC transporter permease subunit PstC [Nocardioides sp. JQ2195]QIX25467.1 phosphate ABC transporter permease subunit PstC [Nocardioides sp. JQ2195]
MSTTVDQQPEVEQTPAKPPTRAADAVFSGTALGAGLLVILFLAGVGVFLTLRGLPALDASGESAYGEPSIWKFVGMLLFGTVYASVIAMIIVTPLAIGLALVISHYAPKRLAKPVGYLVDLLAAVPSVVFGLWGLEVLAPRLLPAYQWLSEHASWIPLFNGSANQRSLLTAAIVLALMALPIVTAILREVFAQTPRAHEEAALALGATRWEMIKLAVFPYARSGMVAAVLLGLGRALGETMAVAMVLSATGTGHLTLSLVSGQNPNTIAAFIANYFANASGSKINTLIFAGLALFLLTFIVNFAGRWIATRGRAKG